MYFAPIVEGHGEMEAVPALLHRLAEASGIHGSLRVNKPIRVKAGSFLLDGDYFRRYVELAAAKAAQESGCVMILLDCEDSLPCVLGPELSRRARALRPDVPILVVLAHREYETWFLTAARSLGGLHGLPNDLEAPPEPVVIRDAKGWLSARMGIPYDPVNHQVEFSRKFDLEQAKANPSFARLLSRFGEMARG